MGSAVVPILLAHICFLTQLLLLGAFHSVLPSTWTPARF